MRIYHEDGTLPESGEIFVFGSNLKGRHGKGAAKVAAASFGASEGRGIGLNGQSYAIPTKDGYLNTLTIDQIKQRVDDFVLLTHVMKDMDWGVRFFVTRVGCGLAGFKDEDIAPLFKCAVDCSFAEQWKEYLE